jgi:hypothetical protein
MLRVLEARFHRHTPTEILVERGPVLIRVLNGATTEIEDVDFGCALFDAMLERYPAIATLAVVEHGTPIPSAAVRRYTAERFGSYAPRLIVGAVFLGLGFWASASLAATSLFMRVLGKQNGMIETSLEEIARKLSLELVGLDPDALVAFIEQLRAQQPAVARVG